MASQPESGRLQSAAPDPLPPFAHIKITPGFRPYQTVAVELIEVHFIDNKVIVVQWI